MSGLGAALPDKGGMGGKKGAKPPQDEEDEEDDDEFVPDEAQKKAILAALRSGNPALVKALQGKLDGLVGRDSGYIDSLPSKARLSCRALLRRRALRGCICAGARRAREREAVARRASEKACALWRVPRACGRARSALN